jgi:poly-gamma-glutamate system protein
MGTRVIEAGTRAAGWLLAGALMLCCAGAAPAAAQSNPLYGPMIAAAQTMQAASRVLYAEKEARGLLPPSGTDPNRTGMIGLEYTTMTTTPGELPAKRTAASPDFAAAMVKLIGGLNLAPGAPVVTVLSGSYVGGDVAVLAALEQLHLKPILIISAGTSQWGANNPEFNIIDMLKLLRERSIITTRGIVVVLGGTDGAGGGQDTASQAALHASAAADGIPVIDTQPLDAEVDELVAKAQSELRGSDPAALINVGAGIVGPGTCDESFVFPPGLSLTPVPCTAGTAGILMKMAKPGMPVIHILNMMRLAAELNLPYDPIPLPVPGTNLALYGLAPAPAAR